MDTIFFYITIIIIKNKKKENNASSFASKIFLLFLKQGHVFFFDISFS